MCGIAGIFYFNSKQKTPSHQHRAVLDALKHRGPDFQGHCSYPLSELYHTRLSILDLSEASHQPFEDDHKNYAMVYNGEVFNYKDLIDSKAHYKSSGDAEAVFYAIKKEKEKALNQFNGFFSIAFLDHNHHELFLARDRYGVKPLYYYQDPDKLVFASELKALLIITGPLELNTEQVYTYFRLNYCAGEERIFKGVYSLAPGCMLKANSNGVHLANWYTPASKVAEGNLESLLGDAVKLRLQADVPVGCFLSGGLDSSIISALAKKEKPEIKTFSLGFKSHPYLDESSYAERVANHIQSSHYAYTLSEDDFLNHLPEFFNCIDEPFADSSAFNFFLLSKFSRHEVKVALSGDGADELFKGYLKHKALLYSKHPLISTATFFAAGLTNRLPSSRENAFHNTMRKLKKLGQLKHLGAAEKQEFLASISTHKEVQDLLKEKIHGTAFHSLFKNAGNYRKWPLEDWFDLNVILAEDMLVKTDRFSMHYGLEIRNPFLDYRVVEFALQLKNTQKISYREQKIILKKQLGHLLPADIVTRPKKGFELPLKSWLTGQLRESLETDWLNEEKLSAEGLFNHESVALLKKQLVSPNPGDSAAKMWALIVFEKWMNNYKSFIKPRD
jgi:asparagine synthase (glutamine-hydrolysing)